MNGSSGLNKCLLDYVTNGGIRLLAIKDQKGKIKGRAIIRILLDTDQKPVLFVERIYGGISSEERTTLIAFAKDRARNLGLPLLTKEQGSSDYGKQLISYGGSAPWGYADAGFGVCRDGKFTVENAQMLFDPASV